jgi:hypothetical protein
MIKTVVQPALTLALSQKERGRAFADSLVAHFVNPLAQFLLALPNGSPSPRERRPG